MSHPILDEKVSELRESVSAIEKENEIQVRLSSRFEETLDKLKDLTESMHRLISLHDERIRVNAKVVEDLKVEMANEVKELEKRVTKETKLLSDKIDQSEMRILAKIAELQKEWEEERNLENKNDSSFSHKINKLFIRFESWKWFILGGVFTAGMFIGDHAGVISKIFSIFGTP